MKTPEQEERIRIFRQRLAAAEVGWLPPVEEREEINDEVLRKCLGIDPESTRPGRMTPGQRLLIVDSWFSGREAKLYAELGLERPPWIPPLRG